MNQGNSLFLFFNLVKKGDLSSAFLVLQIFFLYKYALVRRELLFLLKKKKEIIIDNYLLKVDRFDKGISKDLLVCKKREHLSFEFVKNSLDNNEIVIDIGANIGYYAILESKTAKKGEVYAIEPVSENFKLLKENIIANYLKNCHPKRLAIGEKAGNSQINIYKKKNWSSFNSTLPSEIVKKEKVPVETLDGFVQKYLKKSPTFIRMDVEGHELPILLGAKKILKTAEKLRIMIEIHPHFLKDNGIKKFLTILETNNFKITKINLEAPPIIWQYRSLYNKYRKIFALLPYGTIKKENYNYKFLERLLTKKDQNRQYIYHPHVVFEK